MILMVLLNGFSVVAMSMVQKPRGFSAFDQHKNIFPLLPSCARAEISIDHHARGH